MLKAEGNFRNFFAAVITGLILAVSGVSAQVRDALQDFNGDGKSDWAVVRSQVSPGAPYTWFIRYNGQENLIGGFNFGLRGFDMPVPVDYDGDGKDDIAVYRTTAVGTTPGQVGTYFIINSSNNAFRAIHVGGARGDHAVPADYDGDGKDDPAAFISPSTAQGAGQSYWCYVGSLNNPDLKQTCVAFGARYGTQSDYVDDPYPGDFDGDGKADFAVQRHIDTTQPNSGAQAVFIIKTAAGNVSYQYFGQRSDRVIPGDYDGDGKTDIAVARGFNIGTNPPTPIQWFIRYSGGQPDEYISFGTGINFNFAQGDYDGDGKDDIALLLTDDSGQRNFCYRASGSGNSTRCYVFGTSSDLPLASYNNR